MESVVDLSKRLNRASVNKYYNPYTILDWPDDLDRSFWFYSPELMSCYNTPLARELSEEQLRNLSFYESMNFFSLNIHGEKYLISKMAGYLYLDWPPEISSYLHHFIDEENKHMTLFGEYCCRYGKVYANKNPNFPSDKEKPVEDLLFFIRMMVFEELVDYLNEIMGRDEKLHPLVQSINLNHHKDETRHLVFGRKIIQYLLSDSYWTEERVQGIQKYVEGYFQLVWRQYYNPEMYEDAGLEDGYLLYERLWEDEQSIHTRKSASANCIKFLKENNLIQGDGESCYV